MGQIGVTITESTIFSASWGVVVTVFGAASSFISALVYALAKTTSKALLTKLEDVGKQVTAQKVELDHIKANYVTRADLDLVLSTLHDDLRQSFDRAHKRIDDLYKSPRRELND